MFRLCTVLSRLRAYKYSLHPTASYRPPKTLCNILQVLAGSAWQMNVDGVNAKNASLYAGYQLSRTLQPSPML